MHGIWMVFASRREKIAGFITLFIMIAIILATAGEPQRTVVDGEVVTQGTILGHVVPKWLFFVVGLPIVGGIYAGVLYGLNRLSPEREKSDDYKVYDRASGGFVAWKGEDPTAGSPMDYTPPHLVTALDYLTAQRPDPMRIMILGAEGFDKEDDDFHDELARWLQEAPEETLQALIPAAHPLGATLDPDRLIQAHTTRGIPTLEALQTLAEELNSDALRQEIQWVREENQENAFPNDQGNHETQA